jgi:hypothetical protein
VGKEMDEYGTCDSVDFLILAKDLKTYGSISFPFSADKRSCFMVFMSMDYHIIGISPFGGDRRGTIAVGILGRGFFHFDIKNQKMSPGYVAEKLGLSKEDGEQISGLMRGIANYL